MGSAAFLPPALVRKKIPAVTIKRKLAIIQAAVWASANNVRRDFILKPQEAKEKIENLKILVDAGSLSAFNHNEY